MCHVHMLNTWSEEINENNKLIGAFILWVWILFNGPCQNISRSPLLLRRETRVFVSYHESLLLPWSFLGPTVDKGMVSYFHRFYLVSHSGDTAKRLFLLLDVRKMREIIILCQYFVVGKAFFPSYTLKKFFQWSGNQCSHVPDYNSTVPLFPKSYFKISLVS